MPAFSSAFRKDFPSTLSFHARAKTMLFVTSAYVRLKSTFRQCLISCYPLAVQLKSRLVYLKRYDRTEAARKATLAAVRAFRLSSRTSTRIADLSETSSLVEGRGRIKKTEDNRYGVDPRGSVAGQL